MNTSITATTKPTGPRSFLRTASKSLLHTLPFTDSKSESQPVIYYSDLYCQIITPKTSTSKSSHHNYIDCIINTASPISFLTRKTYNKHYSHLQLKFDQSLALSEKYGVVCGEHVYTELIIKGLDGKGDIRMSGRVWVVEEREEEEGIVVVGKDLLVPANAKIELSEGREGKKHVLCVGEGKSLLGFRSGWPYTAFPTSRKVLDLDE